MDNNFYIEITDEAALRQKYGREKGKKYLVVHVDMANERFVFVNGANKFDVINWAAALYAGGLDPEIGSSGQDKSELDDKLADLTGKVSTMKGEITMFKKKLKEE